jgi:hypothetical protein
VMKMTVTMDQITETELIVKQKSLQANLLNGCLARYNIHGMHMSIPAIYCINSAIKFGPRVT